ncbi:MAG: class I SAM-dependent RNA methyltransferase [Nitrospiraceae bacterium]|nr:class I SAM-dependent RNA methyltransferase [Nitrospiraceae bacterium]
MSVIIKAETPVYGGYTIARDNGIIFISGAIPEETVEVSIVEKKKDYMICKVSNVLEPSDHRIEPLCPAFGICGGCHLQFISYDKQITMKEEVLLDSLLRIANIAMPLAPSLTDKEYNYRHRAQLKISPDGKAGFYKKGTREVVPLKKCPLMIEKINELLKKADEMTLLGISEMHISYGDEAIALIKTKSSIENMEYLMAGIGLSGIVLESGDSIGKDHVRLDLNGLEYTVTPWSFFQSHWELNKKVVELILNELGALENRSVLDLYAGAGNFSLLLAKRSSKVTAVEENPHAVEDGERNAKLNNIINCRFIKTSAEKYRLNEKFDIIILDPPRHGLTSDILKKIVDNLPEKIVYVSCNPATFARDLKKLKERYNIDSIRMIDFFPNTYHVEALAFLSKRE